MATETMPTADEYAVGRSDERRLEREATLHLLRSEASGRSAPVRDALRAIADVIERGEHRTNG